jgi:hypothetical protein
MQSVNITFFCILRRLAQSVPHPPPFYGTRKWMYVSDLRPDTLQSENITLFCILRRLAQPVPQLPPFYPEVDVT